MTSSEASYMFFIYLISYLVLNFGYPQREHEGKTHSFLGGGTGHIPPRPNSSLTLTAKPDPFEAEDPTTQAKLILRRDLFSNENGGILFYALLVSQECFTELPKNGSWDMEKGWPRIPNWKWENTSYQVTPPKWEPFKNGSRISYTLGDGTCDSEKHYCNTPLKENTKYTLKVRAFTNSSYQDTDLIRFQTLDRLPVCRIASLLGGFLLLTAIAVCLSIFDLVPDGSGTLF